MIVHKIEAQRITQLPRFLAFDRVNSVAFSPDGKKLIAGNSRGVVRVWDLDSKTLIREFIRSSDTLLGRIFDAILDFFQAPLIRFLGRSSVRSTNFSYFGDEVSVVSSNSKWGGMVLRMWDMAGGKLLRKVPLGSWGSVWPGALSPD
ncbi:MAG: hypothetical protein HYT89_07555, partial [Candidatus Omnitrophica bacterium]|nr:hypothetical protein [Candidatus Omnitrophota bacterium]